MREIKMPDARMSSQIDNIVAIGKKVFKTDKDTLDWLFTRQKELDGLTPYKMLSIGEGDKVIRLLESTLGK